MEREHGRSAVPGGWSRGFKARNGTNLPFAAFIPYGETDPGLCAAPT